MGPLAIVVALAAGFLIYNFLRGLGPQEAAPQKPVPTHEVIRTTLATLAFAAAVLAGVYAYRKQRLAEGDADRADDNQLAERYTTAAEQLGHAQAAVRLAGVYAMTRLADDWIEQRQVCINVLCAYLRMPYEPDPEAEAYKQGEREVRHTIIRVIRDHLRRQASISWSANDFDFTHANFDGGDLSESRFQGSASFNDAKFSSGTISFDLAEFSGHPMVDLVDFRNAEFSGGEVGFRGAKFNGSIVLFSGADFSGGTVSFLASKFIAGGVYFDRAKFSGSRVDFGAAKFIGGKVGFGGAEHSGGTVNFNRVEGAPQDWGPFQPPAGPAE
ncbi:pentapeptide repeat-containing protein [Streptomyces sp. ISL-43]|uniref:pentapeptide repeat-containing protein n=1 Tax=Streptomyces sp. ISL-43 TaxID=2819183 RepID=UPI001BE8203C|nr:pentapeptide repeat-containing protein [Streptomyces sp. ISL-43]MBT2449670.1 pentapeptide repeat-containing protein [Streptomyces sp. ISL-43]